MAKSVLVVDDDEDIREVLEALIARWGYEVASAGSGKQALEVLRGCEELPGLVLLDLTMPDMSGWAVRDAMLADARLAEVPVVVLSGMADADTSAEARRTAGVLLKPVRTEKLHEVLDEHLGAAA
jgi:CheY-like chemotaxis protein